MVNNLLLFTVFFTYSILLGDKWEDSKHYLLYFIILTILILIIKKCTNNKIIKVCFPERGGSSLAILFIAGILGIFIGRKLKKQSFEFIPKDLKFDLNKIAPWK